MGVSRKDDSIPEMYLKEPTKGKVVEIEQMLSEYYEIQRWDADGKPTPERLSELGIN